MLKSLRRRVPGLRRVARMRRSRGFGVHSPFAFRFVTCVLRERGEYYSYEQLRSLAKDKRDFRRLALLFRLVCELHPDSIISDGIGEDIRKTILLADSRIRLLSVTEWMMDDGSSGKSLYLASMSDCDTDVAERIFLEEGAMIMPVITAELCERIKKRLISGMTFTNGRICIFVSRRDLPRQDFEVDF